MPAHSMTPRSYVAKIAKYRPGDPRRDVAVRRAALAVQAARAANEGDLVMARRSLEGLREVRGLGIIDSDEMALIIRRTAIGGMTLREAQNTARTITTIVSVAGSILNIIGAIVGGDVRLVLGWVTAILTASAPPGAINDTGFRSFCTAWQTMSGSFVGTASGLIIGAAEGPDIIAAALEGRAARSLPADTRNAINLLVRWIHAALDSICREVGPVDPPPAAEPPLATTQRPLPPTPTPEQAARYRWGRAVRARRVVEFSLASPNTSPSGLATARAQDAATAVEMCAAETALLGFMPMLPAFGVPLSALDAANAERVLATGGGQHALVVLLGLAPLFSYLAPSSQPRCYLYTPPTGGCSCPKVRRDGEGGGGGGAALLIALPALAWMFLK